MGDARTMSGHRCVWGVWVVRTGVLIMALIHVGRIGHSGSVGKVLSAKRGVYLELANRFPTCSVAWVGQVQLWGVSSHGVVSRVWGKLLSLLCKPKSVAM